MRDPTKKPTSQPLPTQLPLSYPSPTYKYGRHYYTTEQVAKIIVVTKPAVIKWRNQKIFIHDLLDHNRVYWYEAEHVWQLKAVYHKDWVHGGYTEAPNDNPKPFSQNLNNLPAELSEAKRFFPVVVTPDGKKLPRIKEWQNPDNQKFAAQIEGLVGFDTCGHSIGEDYLFFDFDHVLDNNGNFVNDDAYRWYNFCASMESFCEKSISGHGIHILAKPTPNKFSPISAGSRGTLHFGKDAKLEIFYKPKARYCLVTGDLFNCEPNTPIVYGEITDDIFQTLLNEISKKNPVLATKSKGRDFNCADDADYTEFCALRMLDDINPIVLEDSDWLAVISACKNIGVSYAVVDAFNRRDPERYNEKENETRWQSIDDSSFNIRTLHGIAKRFGYSEKDSRREWYKLYPELKPSTSKNIDDKTKHDLDEAIIFLDNFSADNLSVKDIYNPNTIHFVALAQTYGFIA